MELYKKHISDLGRIVTGKTPRTSIPDNYGGKIPFLTPSDDLTGKYAPQTNKTITQLGLNEVKNCLLPSKSVCVSCIGSDLGKAVITNEPTVTNQQFNSIIPNEENDADFVYYLMIIVGKHLNFLSKTSTAVPIINKSTFSDYEVDVPSLSDQRRIAKILSSLDNKIECNRRINENLEQQAQALFKSWFVDFEPFKDQPFVESELGMIPQGWRVECLNEFGKIVCGKTPSKAESSYYGGNIPFVKIPDMHNNIFVLHSEDCLSDLGDKSQVGKRIPPYSVLVSCIATVGLVGMNVRTCHTNQQINTIIPNSIEYRYYLYQKLVSLREYLINLGRGGTATLNVNTRQFGNIRIVRPSDKVLSEYHQRISFLFDKIEINSLESRRLAELRDTLLPKLMSGELKVNDVDA